MAVCQFFLRGQCRFGDSCRNEHPAGGQQSSFGNSSWTRTAAATATGASNATPDVAFTAAVIQSDLTPGPDKPIWPLSSYGPSKHEPNLIAGLDESQEELRTKYVAAVKAGNLNEYLQYESSKIAAAEQVYSNARTNSTQAYEQALRQSTAKATSSTSVFGQPSASVFPSTSSAFGSNAPATSAFGNTSTTAFGNTTAPATSAFGNVSTPAKSAFGSTTTPSAFGASNTTTSAFGSTTTPSAFGSTTAPSAFGKSTFGQPAFGQTAFGQTGFGAASSTPATTGAFGQPQNTTTPASAFGQPVAHGTTAPTSAFGQPAQSTTTTSAFGQPTTTSAFGQPSFGQSSQPGSVIKPSSGAFSAFAGSGASPFGGGAATTTSPPTTAATGAGGSGFSAFAGTPSAFGGGAMTSGSVFGQPAFGQPVAGGTPTAQGTTSAFGIPAQDGAASVFGTPSVFGAPAQKPRASTTSVFGGGSPRSAFSGTTNASAPVSAFGPMQTQTQLPASAFGDGGFGTQAPTTQPTLSVFAPVAPSISMEMKSSVSSSAAQAKPLDFTLMKAAYKAGATPYDQALPPDYADVLPKDAMDAFRAAKLEWGGVPEWVPPLSVR